ncbi:Piso0_002617 [Millerozyma farinosa CBS 7064]|uniref:Piso0_002617 protein n=1 Tax=Pichia sorbitophila (strain ATCC MYA-4447 / BCRC 22081 / CBS 7064 / NBRC 10061 / NRRL Y-12695) TaxID=559304 RepID=G8YD34_PICSO|nr:Piso0_002617 [Millerozyma farinosa CBS 7064]
MNKKYEDSSFIRRALIAIAPQKMKNTGKRESSKKNHDGSTVELRNYRLSSSEYETPNTGSKIKPERELEDLAWSVDDFEVPKGRQEILSSIFKQIFGLSLLLEVLTACTYLTSMPHMALQFRENSTQGTVLLSSISEALKMISYLAKDLSVTLNDNVNILKGLDYINTIDTFSSDYVYLFSPFQYCRYSSKTSETTVVSTAGLDVFSSLVIDIGLKLGDISRAESSEKMAESLKIAYSQTVSLLHKMFADEGKKVTLQKNDLAMLEVVNGLKSSETYGKTVLLISIAVNTLNPVLCICFFVLLISPSHQKKWMQPIRNNFLACLIPIMVLFIFSFGLLLCHWLSEILYYYKVSSFFNKMNIAKFSLSSGFIMLTVCIFFYVLTAYRFTSVLCRSSI